MTLSEMLMHSKYTMT